MTTCGRVHNVVAITSYLLLVKEINVSRSLKYPSGYAFFIIDFLNHNVSSAIMTFVTSGIKHMPHIKTGV